MGGVGKKERREGEKARRGGGEVAAIFEWWVGWPGYLKAVSMAAKSKVGHAREKLSTRLPNNLSE